MKLIEPIAWLSSRRSVAAGFTRGVLFVHTENRRVHCLTTTSKLSLA